MMKSKYLAASLFLLFVSGAVSVDYNPFKIEVEAWKTAIVLYEPLWFRVKVTNVLDESAVGNEELQVWVQFGNKAWPVHPNGDETHYLSIGRMKPQETRILQDYVYSGNRGDLTYATEHASCSDCLASYAFSTPGTYQVWLTYLHKSARLSNIIEVSVVEPYGQDAQAVSRYSPQGIAMGLNRSPGGGRRFENNILKSILGREAENQIEYGYALRKELLSLYPESTYAPYAAMAICFDEVHLWPLAIQDTIRRADGGRHGDLSDPKELEQYVNIGREEFLTASRTGYETCTHFLQQYRKELPPMLVRDMLILMATVQSRLGNGERVEQILQQIETEFPDVVMQAVTFSFTRNKLRGKIFDGDVRGLTWLGGVK